MSGRIIMQATCVYVSYAGYGYMSDVSIISLTSLIVVFITLQPLEGFLRD